MTTTTTKTSIISVLVETVRHTSEGFSVYEAEQIDQGVQKRFAYSNIVSVKQFVGPVARGQRWTLAGRMEVDERWLARSGKRKEQFVAQFATLGVPRHLPELGAMLSSGLVGDWNQEHYLLLREALGAKQVLNACLKDRSQLAEIDGITEAMIDDLAETLQRAGSMAEIYTQLADWQITGRMADRLVKHYGIDTVKRLTEDPYKDILEISGYGWNSADALGNRLGILADDLRRIRAGIAVALHEATWQAGHTWMTEYEATMAATRLLRVAQYVVVDAMAAAKQSGQIVVDGGRLYPAPLYEAEETIADQVAQRANEPIWNASVVLADLQEPATVDAHQWLAVCMALKNQISLLTGGPGVGKTTTLKALVAAARELSMQVTCMAPTGKAAARMTEATGWPATTIHSRLKLVPGVMSAPEEIEPVSGLVIVDEVSMLDTQLAAQLLSRLAPSAQLLLVGDPDQLPSVGPGAVLRDLLDANIIPRVHLDRVYRNEAGIAVNAARIRNGEQLIDVEDVQLIAKDDPQAAASYLRGLLVGLHEHGYNDDDILVLCPTNKGPSGRYTLNSEIQPLINPAATGSGITQYAGSRSDEDMAGERRTEELRDGDRVMVTKNSTELGVFNGQIGRIVSVSPPRSLDVDIDGRIVHFAGEDKRMVTLAYAITGHKSQGSEAKVIIAPIFPSRVLSREWLYTVLTRARERAYLIGDIGAMQSCLAIRRAHERHSGLVSRIHARLAAAEAAPAQIEA